MKTKAQKAAERATEYTVFLKNHEQFLTVNHSRSFQSNTVLRAIKSMTTTNVKKGGTDKMSTTLQILATKLDNNMDKDRRYWPKWVYQKAPSLGNASKEKSGQEILDLEETICKIIYR